MKRIRLSALTAALLALSLLSVCAQTDRPSVPALINYQGYFTDSSNVPLGAAAGTNYDVQFKLFSIASGGTALWGEKQTVTIAAGQCSVLLGNGTAIAGTPTGSLATFFGPGGTTTAVPSVFLEITVNTLGQTTAAPFTPRQQLVANPFALRAKNADMAQAVAANSITSAAFTAGSISGGTLGPITDGSITAADLQSSSVGSLQLATSAVTSLKIADGTIATADLADSAVTTVKIADGTIAAADLAANSVGSTQLAAGAVTAAKIAANAVGSAQITDGSVAAADLDPALGTWNRNGTNLFWNSGLIGIGTGTPLTNLHVIGTTTYDHIRLDAGTGTLGAFLTLNATGIPNGRHHRIFSTGGVAGEGPGKLVFQDASAGGGNIMTLATNKVGIGTVNPATTLEVASNDELHALRIRNTLHANHAWDVYVELESGHAQGIFVIKPYIGGNYGGWMGTSGDWHQASDFRLKKQVLPMDSPLAGVMRLRPVTYRFKTEMDDAERHLGLIAQEVEAVFPEVVSECSGIKGIAYAELSSVAIGAIQELKKEKDAELKARDEKIASLEKRLAALEQRMGDGVAAEGNAVK